MTLLVQVLQVVVALGLLNVWLLRFNRTTAYRGGKAANIREEFATYGLPPWSCHLVGFLKVSAAICLLAGLAVPGLTQPAALVIAILMVGAVTMHLKIRDPFKKAVPALLMLLLSLVVCLGPYLS